MCVGVEVEVRGGGLEDLGGEGGGDLGVEV